MRRYKEKQRIRRAQQKNMLLGQHYATLPRNFERRPQLESESVCHSLTELSPEQSVVLAGGPDVSVNSSSFHRSASAPRMSHLVTNINKPPKRTQSQIEANTPNSAMILTGSF